MGITALDIKIRKSQRLTDNPDGGGRMVAGEVVDGVLNNLFPDISTQDRVSGRVSMRKAFVHVDTANTDTLYGAVGVVMEPPEDDNVNVTMFSTGSYADERRDARNRIESYITKGVESRYVLFGDHFIGQRSITVYCMKDAPTPEINETLALSVETIGYTANSQYVRVQDVVSRTTQDFFDSVSDGAFQRDVITFNTTTSLLYDFPGQEADRRTSIKPPTRVRLTNVADASSYFGIRKLTLAAAIGDLMVKVASPYVPLVPSTQAETPVVDVLAGMGTVSLIAAGAAATLTLADSSAYAAGLPVTRFLGNPIVKGSVVATVAGTTLTDNGRGELTADGGVSAWSGSVDYLGGSVSLQNSGAVGSVAATVTATPAGAVSAQAFSAQIEVTALNRQNNYILQLKPLPAAGTVTVDYRALGKWIRLSDNGTGQLAGAPGQGSGSVNYATGSVIVTLGALPDLDSAVIVAFGTGVQTAKRNGDAAILAPSLQFTLPHTGIKPGTVSSTWTTSGSPVTAIDNGAGGMTIGGVLVGSITYATGEIVIRVATLPDGTSQISTTYTWSDQIVDTFTPTIDGSGNASINLGGAVRPGGLRFTWVGILFTGDSPTGGAQSRLITLVARDDGAGNIVGISAGGAGWSGTIGSVTYATGVLTIKLRGHVFTGVQKPVYGNAPWGLASLQPPKWLLERYDPSAVTSGATSGAPVNVEWQTTGASDTAATSAIALPPVELDLTPTVIDAVVPGSVRFDFRGRTYVDRSGSLYYDIAPASGAGTYAGTVDYASGKARISSWAAGGSSAVTVTALLTRFTPPGQDSIFFRTPGSPLRPGSFTLRANRLDGTQLTATANLSGVITGAGVAGQINWQSGAAYVRFGQMVTAAGNEAEPWYDPAGVVGGQVWRPALVIPDTVFFGTVVYRSIPLNPAILGLDPVRLPEDGRVVIFKPGQTVLVHHTQTTSIASPAAGQVVNFGRPNVARVEVRDSDGTAVDSIWYVIDKASGTLTFANPLNLAAYALPIVIRDRIEDRVLCADAQITGEIALNRPLAHAYPLGASLSTCLILGEANGSQDIQARVENIFDQQTWTSVFSDLLIGSGTDAQYNDVVYPFTVDNANAITERWALRFTNATSFEVIGERTGIIANGTTAANCAPLNPRTGLPYFTINKDGWGAGWSAGNVLRFNTIGGLAPVWFIRTTLAGELTQPYDGFRFEAIGDANP